MDKKTTINNIKEKLKDLKKEIKKLQNDRNTASSPVILDAFEAELDAKLQEQEELQNELDTLCNEAKKSSIDLLLSFVQDKDIAYLADEGKYVMVNNVSTSPEMINLKENTIDTTKIAGVLNALLRAPRKFNNLNNDEIRGVFEDANKSYIGRTSSFNEAKWDSNLLYNSLPIQKKYWCELSEEPYNELFDDLICSVSGGKQENIDHLEQWIGYKYLYPDRSVTTPNIELVGQPGGNGKGILKTLLKSVFIPQSVGGIKVKQLIGGFNASMEGKVVVVVDDPPKNSDINDHFKESAGNADAVIERKGIDAYEVDNTYNWLITVNNPLIKLYGGGRSGEDRRISVLFTNIKLVDHLMKKHLLSEKQASDCANEINKLASDRREAGKWLNHIIQKHDLTNTQVLLALHGEDYDNRFEDQKDLYTETFEEILPILQQNEFIPNKFVSEIIEAKLNKKVNARTISNRFAEYLNRQGIEFEQSHTTVQIECNHKAAGSLKGRVKRIKGSTNNTFNYSHISKASSFNENNPIESHDLKLSLSDNSSPAMDKLQELLGRENAN